MRAFQPRSERLEEYWTVEATKLETKLRGEITEEGWSYREIEKIVTGSDEGKGIKKFMIKPIEVIEEGTESFGVNTITNLTLI